MNLSRFEYLAFPLLGAAVLFTLVDTASAQAVSREQDIVGLRLGQRVLVDDGSCPTGQIKEVLGAQMTTNGLIRIRKCIPRLGRTR
jgi:hypothetical protein